MVLLLLALRETAALLEAPVLLSVVLSILAVLPMVQPSVARPSPFAMGALILLAPPMRVSAVRPVHGERAPAALLEALVLLLVILVIPVAFVAAVPWDSPA